jgi:hypothetical protein
MSQDRIERHRRTNIETEVMSGALVGLGVIAIVQMLSVPSLDVPLKVSLYSFAISIPFLTVAFLCARIETGVDFRSNHPLVSLAFGSCVGFGNLSSLAGISALFFHFMNYAGFIFIGVCVIGLVVWVAYEGAAAEDLNE